MTLTSFALPRFTWNCSHQGYAVRTVRKDGKTISMAMHRLILGAQPAQLVDHIDGNRRNNTCANRRLVTPRQNQHNRQPNRRSTSVYKCITRLGLRWQARIRVNGQCLALGYFDTPQEAADMYDAAARHFFGRYARTNVPRDPVRAGATVALPL